MKKGIPNKLKSSNGYYYLLPFRFERINQEKEILINEVGDYLICDIGTASKIVNRQIDVKSNFFGELISNYFISKEPIPALLNLLANRYRTKKSFIDNFTGLHIFVLTLRCNHLCHYCQVSRKNEKNELFDMQYENIDLSINLMFKTPSVAITMEFQGGEPLLVFNKIKYSIERVKKLNKIHNKKINYVICTNLTLVNDEILTYCLDNDILISTSLDGPKNIHDENRLRSNGPSYESVVNALNFAKKRIPLDRISALMTTTRMALNHPKEIIDSYIENGFNHIFLRAISPYGFAAKNKNKNEYETEKFVEFFKIALDYIIKLNNEGVYFVEDYTALILKKILTPFPIGFVDLQSPSGLINGVVVYNYDGYVYASDEARMLAESGDYSFRLGKISDNYNDLFYGEKAKEISENGSLEALPGCSECAFQVYCGADPIRNYVSQGDTVGYRPTSNHCFKNKSIISHIINLINDGRNNENEIFRSWI
ncbi:His-Xaa-Ser system radical SAM maturase HxsB [Lutibacter sp. HS1-25]|uniref:His-Xaa-Ser system radical SAM maturase HxsB n=1 Tax=Lutibacter sp. HS1-25 TaxID=2485000 RepID=UPI00101267D9|nr:His-Xaa-Ser system radical SAM maturase HxsB [Lutibacter sp. HS1-25]RXP46858.1 His-Xaa-Ser system radical SAM maturase HxsB [Lutibacter sp. HS1-25]